jgi:hypothetical protein
MVVALMCWGCLATVRAADTGFGGEWKVNTDISGRKNALSVTLIQNGDKLTGTVNNPDGKNQAITGSVDGRKVTWQYDVSYKMMKLTMVYEGAVDEVMVMKGTIKVRPFGGGGSFVATVAPTAAGKK